MVLNIANGNKNQDKIRNSKKENISCLGKDRQTWNFGVGGCDFIKIILIK